MKRTFNIAAWVVVTTICWCYQLLMPNQNNTIGAILAISMIATVVAIGEAVFSDE